MVFHTVCTVDLFEDASTELYAQIFSRLRQIENTFNNYSPASEISYVNQNAACEVVPVSEDLYIVLKTALDFCELTGGAYDVTVGPLVKLWNISGGDPHVPTREEFEQVLPLLGYKNVIIIPRTDVAAFNEKMQGENTDAPALVQFAKDGVQLDLGSIAKGFAADEVERILKENNVRRAMVNLGGNIYVHGKKNRKEEWSIGIKNPFGEGSSAMVQTHDNSVVTSGGYERFFERDGKRYSHILNPVTGYPVQTEIAGVTIITPNSMLADALSTSVFVCGIERVAEFRQSKVCGEFECVAIMQDGKIFATRGLEKSLVLPKGANIVWF